MGIHYNAYHEPLDYILNKEDLAFHDGHVELPKRPGLGVEVKRGINPDLVEQATAQDEQYRLEDEDNLPENDAFSPDSAETVRSREAAPPR